ncbi:hypothetical protein [Litorisediminicola beolgyonensis]|uniref:Uncharacterized protein n=1 Tax=Litorisediminicola beolgyonensis TaxID=1173614 RepID=A0ABW3ZFU8_9RHOB
MAAFTLQISAARNRIISQPRDTSGHRDTGTSLIVAAFASQYLSQREIVVSHLTGYWG